MSQISRAFKKQSFYKEWRAEYKKNNNNINIFLQHMLPGDYFTLAFVWDKTNKGHEYWANLNHDWQQTLKATV